MNEVFDQDTRLAKYQEARWLVTVSGFIDGVPSMNPIPISLELRTVTISPVEWFMTQTELAPVDFAHKGIRPVALIGFWPLPPGPVRKVSFMEYDRIKDEFVIEQIRRT